MSHNDLFFLRSQLLDAPLNKGYRWSLQVVKVNDTVLGAYLAFRSPELAQRFAGACENVSVVSAADLDGTHYTDFENKLLVLFESSAELERCLADRAHYPFEQHLAKYTPKDGLLQNAV